MNWIEWALSTELGTSEKLLLVYLASRVNREGVGLMRRDELQRVMGFETRSIQRLLKTLRDAGILRDAGPWFVLSDGSPVGVAPAEIEVLPTPPEGSAPEPLKTPLLAPADIEQAADRLGAAIQDGAEFLVDQLNNAEARLAGMLVRGAQQLDAVMLAGLERLEALPRHDTSTTPPPDPVLESDLFKKLAEILPHDVAYGTAKAQLERQAEIEHETVAMAEGLVGRGKVITEIRPNLVDTPKRDAYTDDSSGRFWRVWDILHDKPPTDEVRMDLGARWSMLEEEENKHSVKGESATAFENLYPAIVRAAQQNRGRITMREFLDPVRIREGRAPWDVDGAAVVADDTVLQAEVNDMLRQLGGFNDPRATAGPRTTEKGEDGVMRQETMLAYHRRVKAKLAQMIKLRDMGALT